MPRKVAPLEIRKARRKAVLEKYSKSKKRKESLERFKNSGNYTISKAKYHLKERNYVIDGNWHLIEGYDRMIAEGFNELNRGNRWVLHHRLEEQGFTQKQLKDAGMYFERPPKELIWMTRSEHNEVHKFLRRRKPFFAGVVNA